MAKTLKRLQSVLIMADENGNITGQCELVYQVGSTDDVALEKNVIKLVTLTGQDLTDATTVFNNCESQVKTDESIA